MEVRKNMARLRDLREAREVADAALATTPPTSERENGPEGSRSDGRL